MELDVVFMFSKFCAEEKLKTKTSEHPGLSVDARELSRLQQLIIRPGEGGGIITQTEFMFPMFCAEEKLKKKTSDRLISIIKRRNFVIEAFVREQFGRWKHFENIHEHYSTRTTGSGLQVPDIPI